MKDSGVEWIGEIPEHWQVIRIKDSCILNPAKSEVDKESSINVTFIPMENVLSAGKVDTSIEKPLSEVYGGYTYFKDGDIVVAKVTPCFENGNIAILAKLKNGIGFGTTEFHVIRTQKDYLNKYLYYVFQSERFRQEGVSSMYGVAGLKRIPSEFIANYKFAIPNLNEQVEVANYLDK